MPNISAHQLTYSFQPNTQLLSNVSFQHHQGKLGVVGRNGAGKSTLLELLVGTIQPQNGSIERSGEISYCRQLKGNIGKQTVADLLGIREQLQALENIERGSIAERDFDLVGERWDLKLQAQNLLQSIELSYLQLSQPASVLSGGELARLLIARGLLSQADYILLDEPTNHLDSRSRSQLIAALDNSASNFIIVSHDRQLLNHMDAILELSPIGSELFGGNYDFYVEQKAIQNAAIEKTILDCDKQLKKHKRVIQATREKYEQRSARAKSLRKKNDQPKVMQNFFENRAGQTASKMAKQAEGNLAKDALALENAKSKKALERSLDLELAPVGLPSNKLVVEFNQVSFAFSNQAPNIIDDFSFAIYGSQRISIQGPNGCGKSTLIKLLLGEISPLTGTIKRGDIQFQILDQSVGLLDEHSSVLDNFLSLNADYTINQAHEILAKFLFRNVDALKKVSQLSGGERLRAGLACVLKSNTPPQCLILDEPSNHLDLDSLKHLEAALLAYTGALIVISHDQYFLNNIGIERTIVKTQESFVIIE